MGQMNIPRRVVTGHDENGKSVFVSDGATPTVMPRGEAAFFELWNTNTMPAPISDLEPSEPTDRELALPPRACGTIIRMITFPPGHRSPMHRTETIDYGIVLEGEVHLVLDESETAVRAGDVVIQRGTDHAWQNRSDQWARIVFILIDGQFDDALKASLGDVRAHARPVAPNAAASAPRE
jgi:quercetin dioxygenase-like cupin family protein